MKDRIMLSYKIYLWISELLENILNIA